MPLHTIFLNCLWNYATDQIGFYDFYIIPLAMRVKGCASLKNGVGYTIFENAQRNRQRWVAEGREVTERMISSYSGMFDIDENQTDRSNSFGQVRRADSNNSLTALAYESDVSIDSGIDEESLSLSGLRSVGRCQRRPSITTARPTKPKVNKLDATVPPILAGQILDTIHERCRSSLAEAYASIGDVCAVSSAQDAIASYWQTGSIMRYRACILLVDISGFTNMAQMFAVDHFKTFINDYFTKIIDIITSHGGEVAKFAGDALYAVWTTSFESDDDDEIGGDREKQYAVSVARCIACGSAINAKCNNYRVAHTYSRHGHEANRGGRVALKQLSNETVQPLHKNLGELRLEDTVNLNADSSGYDEKVAFLNVHCGIAEGIVAGVNVCARMRSEFFFIGTPMAEVAQAEGQACAGELIISSSAKHILDANRTLVGTDGLENLEFVQCESGGFFKVQRTTQCARNGDATNAPDDPQPLLPRDGQPVMSARTYIEAAILSMRSLVSSSNKSGGPDRTDLGVNEEDPANLHSVSTLSKTRTVTWRRQLSHVGGTSLDDTMKILADTSLADDDPSAIALKQDLVSLLESHSHESVRAVKDSMMPAELRNVVVLFIKILYEPELSTSNNSDDEAILDRFQQIFSTIHASLLPFKGQVRQFISDDKGLVCIASFGLRGSATLNLSATAVDAAIKIQEQLLQITETECTIGGTLGKGFCGEIGCPSRYEFSIVGSSVNLSARLMAKGARGTINCDEALVANDTEHQYSCTVKHRLKGYEQPVRFYNPELGDEHAQDNTPLDTSTAVHSSVRRDEIRKMIEHIQLQQELMVEEEEENAREMKGEESESRKFVPQTRAVMVSARAGAGKAQFLEALLDHPDIKSRSTVLVANKCYHNTPFYCWVPIISKIVKTSTDVVKRVQKLKRLRRKLLFPPSLISNAAIDSPEMIDNAGLVTNDLLPYLSLLNDFLFMGAPLFRPSDEVKSLKDTQKVDKAVEVLRSMVQRYISRFRRPAIIAISDIDTIDDCSKNLVQSLFESDTKLVFLCGTQKGAIRGRRPSLESTGSTMSTSTDVIDFMFGDSDNERTEFMRLEPLSKEAVFEVFKSSIRGISEEDEEMIDWMRVAEMVHELCGGVVRHAIELAHAVSIELRLMSKVQCSAQDRTSRIVELLEDFPVSKMEELIALRFDALTQEQQLLLKVASVPGLNQHSFSLNLLETLMLDVSAGDVSGDGIIGGITGDSSSHGAIPLSVGSVGGSQLDDMFQGDNFEIMVDSLVEAGFLILIDDDNADYLSMEATQSFRFASALEQMCVNDLMIEDQKRELHLRLAEHYETRLLGLVDDRDAVFLEDDATVGGGSISTLTTTYTMGIALGTSTKPNWQITHLTATHFSMAAASVQALIYFFDAATELARLGLREKSHGSLLSAYSCFEQRLDQCRRNDENIIIQSCAKERNRLARRLLQMICEADVPPAIEILTQDHLRWMFDANSQDLVLCIKMLFKFGQSIGVIEKEGYLHGAKVYQQVVYLTLLGLSEEAFSRTVSQLKEYLDDSMIVSNNDTTSGSDYDDSFSVGDLAVSFPAFSGLLTFYRDSPIQNETNLVREKVLATLFVAVTEQQDDMVHILRTKCILGHLFMKTGDITKALAVSEAIKSAYIHDEHSLQMVQMYGMDWALINITTIVSVYIFRADISKALDSISFLETQLEKVDEFASSTKAMLKGVVSAAYLLLCRFDKAAAMSNGISSTSYGFFYKPSSILQEGLNKKLARLHCSLTSIDTTNGVSTLYSLSPDDSTKSDDPNDNILSNDFNVLEILGTDKCHSVCFKRSMLHPSTEVLSDRGMEAITAATCMAQIELLEKKGQNNERHTSANAPDQDKVTEQMNYCKAGLVYLEQSLGQKDAGSHEKLTNYLSCLYQKAELLAWRNSLTQKIKQFGAKTANLDNAPKESAENDIEEAISSLQKCEEICLEKGFYLMFLMVGARYINLDLDHGHGKMIVSRAFQEIEKSKSEDDLFYARSVYESLCNPSEMIFRIARYDIE